MSLSPNPGEKFSSLSLIALSDFELLTLHLIALFLYSELLSSFLARENKNASSHSK
jgi:hypothetical protein